MNKKKGYQKKARGEFANNVAHDITHGTSSELKKVVLQFAEAR